MDEILELLEGVTSHLTDEQLEEQGENIASIRNHITTSNEQLVTITQERDDAQDTAIQHGERVREMRSKLYQKFTGGIEEHEEEEQKPVTPNLDDLLSL